MKSTCIFMVMCSAAAAFAGLDIAPIDYSPGRNPSPLRVELKRIGTLRPRSANEIKGSSWTLGCECLDRDFSNFDQYRDYIVPLGIKEIRLFAGWAKCEKEPGRFDFAWLDHCIDWACSHGINVLLDVSYGNPIYKGAGGAGLANGMPSSPDGLARWDLWVEKLGQHFKGRVRDFAMWNEPDNGGMNSPAAIADLNVRTAHILKRIVPGCRLHGLSLGGIKPDYFEACMKEIAKLGGTGLFDTYIYHGYAYNPDSTYAQIEKLIEICAKYAPNAKMRQGENGCISEWSDWFAIANYPWSENSQAKWNLRRMLGDLGHGCGSCVFTICDLQYKGPYATRKYLNRKGLLRANENNQVYQIKKAYYAVQNMVSVFDDSVTLAKVQSVTTIDRCLSLYEFVKDGKHPLFVFWDHGIVGVKKNRRAMDDGTGRMQQVACFENGRIPNIEAAEDGDGFRSFGEIWRRGVPSDDFTTRPSVFEWKGAPLNGPVWVDLFTGAVYEIPATQQIVHSSGVSLVQIPAYDSPCFVTERAALDFINHIDKENKP